MNRLRIRCCVCGQLNIKNSMFIRYKVVLNEVNAGVPSMYGKSFKRNSNVNDGMCKILNIGCDDVRHTSIHEQNVNGLQSNILFRPNSVQNSYNAL